MFPPQYIFLYPDGRTYIVYFFVKYDPSMFLAVFVIFPHVQSEIYVFRSGEWSLVLWRIAGVRMTCWFQSGWMACVILVTGFRCIVAGLAEPELNMSTAFREALVSVEHNKHSLLWQSCLSSLKIINMTFGLAGLVLYVSQPHR